MAIEDSVLNVLVSLRGDHTKSDPFAAVLGTEMALLLVGVSVLWMATISVTTLRTSPLTWLLGGAVLLGAVGWLVTPIVLSDVPPSSGLIAGLAIGGGAGTAIRLLVFPELDGDTESVTVEMDEPSSAPAPEPADLFDANPDPIIYYSHNSDGPIARAVNESYTETFGPGAGPIEGESLDELIEFPDTGPILSAVRDGRRFDTVVNRSDAQSDYRVRVIPVRGGTGGYVIFTTVEDSTE